MSEVRRFLERHLDSIFDLDTETYRKTCSDDLTVYQWYLTPHRIDGIDFHLTSMGRASQDKGTVMAWDTQDEMKQSRESTTNFLRYDLANYREQVYGDTAICTYTLLIMRSTSEGASMRSHNETRVVVKIDDKWKVVHVHKSPAWNAPFAPKR